MIPAFVGIPTNTSTPSPEPATPLPTLTVVPTTTSTTQPTNTTQPPTFTSAPTNTLIPGVIETPIVTNTPALATPSVFLGGGSGQIAFASTRSGVAQIYLTDLTGENAFQLTNISSGACQPSWSPDGQRLVFISPCKGQEDVYFNTSLYLINVDGTQAIPLDASPGGNFDPAWSPDGKTIVFASLRTGQMEIFTVNVDDPSTIIQLTNGAQRVEARMPTWSPDGTKLVYVVKRVGVYQIWIMNADGSEQTQIIRSGVAYTDYLPDWSPRGDLILFNQRCASTFCNPYLMSTSATDLTNEQGLKVQINVVFIENIDYSPDGFYLAYEGVGEAGNVDVFYMTLSGGDRIRLTTDPSQDFHPAWRPAITTP